MYHFQESCGVNGLHEILPYWQGLSRRVHVSRFYQRWQWYNAILHYLFDQDDTIRFLVVSKDGTPVPIFPYTIRKEKSCGIVLRVLGFPSHPHLPLCDALIDPAAENFFPSLVDYLRQRVDIKWDVIRLTRLLEGDCVLRHAGLCRDTSLVCEKVSSSAYMRCDRKAPHTEYLSAKFRRNIKRLSNRASRRGIISFKYVRNQENLQAAFEEFLKVEAAGWKGEQGTESAIVLDSSLIGFYRYIVDSFGSTKECRINRMFIDARCIAAQLCIICDRIIYIIKIGYDEEYKDIAPGSLLMNDLIHRCTYDVNIDGISLVTCPLWAERWHVDKIGVFSSAIPGQLSVSA